jgi:hypothetical protein
MAVPISSSALGVTAENGFKNLIRFIVWCESVFTLSVRPADLFPTIRHSIHRRPPMDTTSSQFNTVHKFTPCFSIIRFIIFSLCPVSHMISCVKSYQTKILYEFLIKFMLHTHTCDTLLYYYDASHMFICNFLRHPVTSSTVQSPQRFVFKHHQSVCLYVGM